MNEHGCALSCLRFFVTPWTVAYPAPPSIEFFQARVLEWVAISSSRGSSLPRDGDRCSCIAGGFFLLESSGWLGPSGTGSGTTVLPSGGTGVQPSHPAPEPMCLPPRYNHNDKQYARYCSQHSMCASGWVPWKADIKIESVVQEVW